MLTFSITQQTRIEVADITSPILHAIQILERDLKNTTPQDGPQNVISLQQMEELDAEGYKISVEPEKITVHYRDDLGAVYGLLAISKRFLGVHPFDYWNERVLLKNQRVEAPCGSFASKPQAVRFRGWFVNDEVLLDGWKDSPEDTREMWRRIFETLLRCGGNMVIPGTDRKDDAEALNELALDMGLWLTQHHTELLGARMFSRAYPDVQASYAEHPELFEALWQESIDRYAGRKVIWAVGYRGQGDTAFWNTETGFDTPEARGKMIASVITRQMEMVRACDPSAMFCTNLYGEMMGLYRNGHLPLPEEMIKIWGDNGYGKMVNRRDGNANPRVSSMPVSEPGLNGLYYHASFYDLQAANHITMSQNSPTFLAGELGKAVENGADYFWNLNVGSIKPHIYILDLVRQCWEEGSVDALFHAKSYAKTYYGDARVADLLLGFSEYTMPYGPNEDDRAGDQYYHFVLRHIVRALMRGETQSPMRQLFWAAGEEPFSRQVEQIEKRCAEAVPGWQDYLQKCEPVASQLLTDTLVLQATLHLTGCEGLRDICRASACLNEGDGLKAYLYTHRALIAHRRGLKAMAAAEHGEFRNIYRNDCFSNVRLTVHMLETLRAWIRACYDGELFYDWEKRYLIPSEERVLCLTHRQNQLDDEILCERLMEVVKNIDEA